MTIDDERRGAALSDEEQDEEYDDDEEEEEEPLLKYSTINPVKELLASQRDAASCITVANEVIVSCELLA
jgi:hypothetical protein